jgi:hypothetical protein
VLVPAAAKQYSVSGTVISEDVMFIHALLTISTLLCVLTALSTPGQRPLPTAVYAAAALGGVLYTVVVCSHSAWGWAEPTPSQLMHAA